MRHRILLIGLLALACAACSSVQRHASAHFKPPRGAYQVIVMRPDIAVSLVTAGGTLEPREDWTNQAREAVLNAIRKQQLSKGGTTKVALTREDAGATPELVLEMERLHQAVGQSIQLHKYMPGAALPTKKGRFDWTMGELAVNYGAASGHDYALFLFARDSFASGGRASLQVLGFLGCMVTLVCVIPNGGIQQGFASLVDLKTGNVVWFNYLSSAAGDIRTTEGAEDMVKRLLSSMHEEPKATKNGKKKKA